MGTLGEGNGGGDRPPDRDGLPGLPPEWGSIVIPDDPADLAEETEAVRRELRWTARRRRWRRRLGLRPRGEEPSLGLPLLIMAIAVIATLTSLFAVAWPRPQRQAGDERTARVPTVTLFDSSGGSVRLDHTLPAVVLLVDGCECRTLLTDVAASADPGLSILAVARQAPAVPSPAGPDLPTPPVPRVRGLADPNESLRTALGLPEPTGTASVAVYSRAGLLVRLVPSAYSVDDVRSYLTVR